MATPYDSTKPDAPTGSSSISGLLGLFRAVAQIADWIGGLVPTGARVYDTLNVPIEMESGYTSSFLVVRRIGRTVNLFGVFVRTAGGLEVGAGTEPCFNIPDEFRPTYIRRTLVTYVYTNANLARGVVSIPVTGDCVLGIDSGAAGTRTGQTMYVNETWVL